MTDDEIQIVELESGPPLPIVEGDGSARAVIWPGMGAGLRSIHHVELGRGGRTVALRHPAEAAYYVVAGEGEVVDTDAGQTSELSAGAMVHIDAGTAYVLRAGEAGVSLVGGPSPPDAALYEGLS